jgi:hypothetical protein
MTAIQCKAVAAGFVRGLECSERVRARWVKIFQKRDWPALCLLIKDTLGLAKKPTIKDLEKMRAFAKVSLIKELEELEKLDKRIDRVYCFNGRFGHDHGHDGL